MRLSVIILFTLVLFSCSEKTYDMDDYYKVYGGGEAELNSIIAKVSEKTIIFGHQSVGKNILDGITQLEEKTEAKLNRITTREVDKLKGSAFLDFRVGENGNPYSKIDDFVAIVEAIPPASNSIALFKLCYVDIYEEDINLDEVFKYYKEKMLYLKKNFPDIRIVLVTVPLTKAQKGWKAIVKKILGRKPYGVLENIKRNEFNLLIHSELSAEFPVYDLAVVESTKPDGRVSKYKYKGKSYLCLTAEYSSDMGHLNDFGSEIVGLSLLAFLANEL